MKKTQIIKCIEYFPTITKGHYYKAEETTSMPNYITIVNDMGDKTTVGKKSPCFEYVPTFYAVYTGKNWNGKLIKNEVYEVAYVDDNSRPLLVIDEDGEIHYDLESNFKFFANHLPEYVIYNEDGNSSLAKGTKYPLKGVFKDDEGNTYYEVLAEDGIIVSSPANRFIQEEEEVEASAKEEKIPSSPNIWVKARYRVLSMALTDCKRYRVISQDSENYEVINDLGIQRHYPKTFFEDGVYVNDMDSQKFLESLTYAYRTAYNAGNVKTADAIATFIDEVGKDYIDLIIEDFTQVFEEDEDETTE